MGSSAAASVRRATAADQHAIHQVLVSAFGVSRGQERWESLGRLAQAWPSFVVEERGGQVVAALRLQPDRLRLGPAAVLVKGDVGYVAVRPDLQGRGLGTALMRGAVALMAREGFALSRLGGLNAFYARFAYVPFPRLTCEFPLDPVHAGVATLRPEDFLRPSAEDLACLRPYAPRTHFVARRELQRVYAAGHTGELVLDGVAAAPEGGPDESGLQWVWCDDRGVAACVVAALEGESLQIRDMAAHPARLPALGRTLRRVLWEAVRRGARSATGYLPADLAVQQALVEAGVPFVLRESQTAPASNMLRLVDLRSFAQQALPEWTRRWCAAAAGVWRGVLELRVGEQAVRLAVAADGLHLADEQAPAEASLALAPRAFLLGALGLRAWDEVAPGAEGAVAGSLGPVLATIFRRQPVVGGPLG